MIALFHWLSEWAIILAILAVAGGIAYGLTILRLPGAAPVAIGGIILSGGWYWHAEAIKTARSEVKSEYEAKITKANLAWVEIVRKADDATHAKEKKLESDVTTISANGAKDIENVKANLARALASSRLRDNFATVNPAATCQIKSDGTATVDNDAVRSEFSTEAGNQLRSEAARADEAVVTLTAAQLYIRSLYAVCSN